MVAASAEIDDRKRSLRRGSSTFSSLIERLRLALATLASEPARSLRVINFYHRRAIAW